MHWTHLALGSFFPRKILITSCISLDVFQSSLLVCVCLLIEGLRSLITRVIIEQLVFIPVVLLLSWCLITHFFDYVLWHWLLPLLSWVCLKLSSELSVLSRGWYAQQLVPSRKCWVLWVSLKSKLKGKESKHQTQCVTKVIADLHSHFGGVYNHHGSTALSLSIRKLNKGGKRHPDCEWLHPMGWCSGVNEKEKVVTTSDESCSEEHFPKLFFSAAFSPVMFINIPRNQDFS